MLSLGFAASAQTTLGSITTGSSGCKVSTTVCAGDTVHFIYFLLPIVSNLDDRWRLPLNPEINPVCKKKPEYLI